MTAFWKKAQCNLVEEDRRLRDAYCLRHQGNASSGLDWNVGILQRDHMKLCPRRLSRSYSPPWEPELSHAVNYHVMCKKAAWKLLTPRKTLDIPVHMQFTTQGQCRVTWNQNWAFLMRIGGGLCTLDIRSEVLKLWGATRGRRWSSGGEGELIEWGTYLLWMKYGCTHVLVGTLLAWDTLLIA
jgi:hypothetical protein